MTFLVVVLTLFLTFASSAHAVWQAPVNLGAGVNSASDEFRAALSPDGSTLIFDSNRTGGFGDFDLYQSTDNGGSWGTATILGSGVNTAGRDYTPALSSDGLTLYLTTSAWDIAQSQWTGSAWGARTSVPGNVNSASQEWAPFLSPDASRMYFTGFLRAGGAGKHDLWVSQWTGSSWGTPAGLGFAGKSNEYTGSITADGMKMYLSIDGDIHESDNVGGVWQTPVSLGPTVNASDRWDSNPLISADGTKLYFSSERNGGFGGYDLYVSTQGATDAPSGELSSRVVVANRLFAPGPNPFGASTELRFDLRGAERVTLQVFDVRGRVVTTLVDRSFDEGQHRVSWRGLDGDGSRVPSGIYFARMRTASFQQVQRLVLLR